MSPLSDKSCFTIGALRAQKRGPTSNIQVRTCNLQPSTSMDHGAFPDLALSLPWSCPVFSPTVGSGRLPARPRPHFCPSGSQIRGHWTCDRGCQFPKAEISLPEQWNKLGLGEGQDSRFKTQDSRLKTPASQVPVFQSLDSGSPRVEEPRSCFPASMLGM
jgi:hypothetical protein